MPGHTEIQGNEKADEEAKNAALGGVREEQTPSHYKLKSAQVAKINNDIKAMAKEAWNTGKGNARQLRKLTRPQRVKTGLQLYGALPRKQLTNLVRLRTGHCRIKSYLHHRNIIEDATCDCGNGIENVKHFLLQCKHYEEPRRELRRKVGARNMRMESLLGDPELVKETLEFVEKTGRFNFE